jgi:hypothetical protein
VRGVNIQLQTRFDVLLHPQVRLINSISHRICNVTISQWRRTVSVVCWWHKNCIRTILWTCEYKDWLASAVAQCSNITPLTVTLHTSKHVAIFLKFIVLFLSVRVGGTVCVGFALHGMENYKFMCSYYRRFSFVCYMSRPSHLPWFDDASNIWWRVGVHGVPCYAVFLLTRS